MLELSDVNTFYGKALVLEGISFQVAHRQVTALLGRNGAGKSTTMKSIMQLVPPRSGSIRLNGDELTGKPAHRIAKMGIGFVPEDRRIFTDLTVLENLEVGRQPPRHGAVTWTVDMLFEIFPNLAERRSQKENLSKAVKRLRLQLAVEVRNVDSPIVEPSTLWKSRCVSGRIQCSEKHADFPVMIAEAMDAIDAKDFDVKLAAAALGCSTSQLVRFVGRIPEALGKVNSEREQRGLKKLKT